jgi:hypothetical protein
VNRSLIGLACAALLAAAPLQAQDDEPRRGGPGPSLVPYAGVHQALGTLLTEPDGIGGWEARTGLLLGARLEFPVARRSAIQADVGYATPSIRGFGEAFEDFEAEGRFLSFTARVSRLLTATPLPYTRRIGLSVHAGGGLMRHWVASPRPTTSTWPTAVAGLTVRLPVTRRFTAFLTGDLYVYRASFEDGLVRRAMQQDLRISVGAWLPGN